MILVTGATGKVGEALIQELLASGADFRAGVRTPGRPSGVETVPFDFDKPETFAPALRGITRLFLLSPGGTEREGPVVEAARTARVGHIVKLSVWGAEEESFEFARHHRPIEKQIEASGVPYTFLRPNGFMQNFSTSMADTIRSQGAFYLAARDSRYSIVDARDVAAVAAKALREEGAHAGSAYKLSGPETLSNAEMADKLSAAIGKKVAYVDLPEADFRKALVDAGTPDPYADALIDLDRYYISGQAQEITQDVERVTGLKPRSFDRFASDHAAVWR